MRRADRLFQIVQALRGGRRMTSLALADQLEVSQRTIYRDIADLQGAGVPIDGEAGFGYVLDDGYTLPPLMFTEEEVVALVAGARLIRTWGGASMAKGAEEALIKINAVLPEAAKARERAVHVHAMDWEAPDAQTRVLIDQLEAASDKREKMRLAYRDAEGTPTDRVVRPLGLGFWGKVWTLVAWCETRADFRMFRIDRIVSAEAVGQFRSEPGKRLVDFMAREEEECHR
ncbi:MAG: YafY family protein [Pseudomonadota bacterium]